MTSKTSALYIIVILGVLGASGMWASYDLMRHVVMKGTVDAATVGMVASMTGLTGAIVGGLVGFMAQTEKSAATPEQMATAAATVAAATGQPLALPAKTADAPAPVPVVVKQPDGEAVPVRDAEPTKEELEALRLEAERVAEEAEKEPPKAD